MKKIYTLLLALLIFGIATRDLVVYTHFKIDQDFIAAVLCINKDRPELECDGKCFLKQQIKDNHDTQDQPAPVQLEDRTTIHLYISTLQHLGFGENSAPTQILHFQQMYSDPFIDSLYYPPEVIA